ncbi:transcriptional regulator MerR family [Candidatus Termititenax persephonae]|uniref:Transcriptional regulator MerR family n=1 Tax=Candidatus Termititenax persephonae TaxID=2218525 RepID=A0A388TG49_9BACT|nr:transcriptional regulator MerR family [Candidatus Termititenax persephonae]
MELGSKIRETREQKGITLRKLAKDIGVSPSFISQVEQSKAQPSVDSLTQIARTLGVSSSYLLGEEDTGIALLKSAGGVVKNRFDPEKLASVKLKRLLPENINNNIEPALLVLEPGTGSAEITGPSSGEEFLLLLDGQLDIKVNENTYTIPNGQTFYFPANSVYSFQNSGSEAAKVLWIKA